MNIILLIFFLKKHDYSTSFKDDTTSRKSVKQEFDMPPLKGYEEVELEPEQTTSGRVKLIPRKRTKSGTRLKVLTSNYWTDFQYY